VIAAAGCRLADLSRDRCARGALWDRRTDAGSAPTRQRHGCELCTDGARVASERAVRIVSASGKYALISAIARSTQLTLCVSSTVACRRLPRQRPKSLFFPGLAARPCRTAPRRSRRRTASGTQSLLRCTSAGTIATVAGRAAAAASERANSAPPARRVRRPYSAGSAPARGLVGQCGGAAARTGLDGAQQCGRHPGHDHHGSQSACFGEQTATGPGSSAYTSRTALLTKRRAVRRTNHLVTKRP
jgi:hypothetical protein